MSRKRNNTQNICDEAIHMLENGFLRDRCNKRQKMIQESKEEERRECLLLDGWKEEEEEQNKFHDFFIVETKGSGAFGRIMKVKKDGKKYAIKQAKVDGNRHHTLALENERSLLKILSHDNIVQHHNHHSESQDHFMVLEYMPLDLDKVLRDKNRELDAPQRQSIMRRLLDAVNYLHKQEILHRDLKPSNILCSKDLRSIKICDFGLSTKLVKNSDKAVAMNPYVVTLWYRAPELLLQHQNYDGCIDIWSLGLIAIELCQPHPRMPVFCKSTNEGDMVQFIIKLMGVPSLPEQHPNHLPFYLSNFAEKMEADLICHMLNLNMTKRITASAALEHLWLKDGAEEECEDNI